MAVSKSYPSWTPTTKEYAQIQMTERADYNFGETLTHEAYNYWINKLGEYDRYNNQVLENLFNETNEGRVYRIPYIDNRLQELERFTTDTWNDLQIAEDDIDALETLTQKMINGTQQVGYAKQADKVVGIDTCGKLHYYGTDKDNAPGFHAFPPMVYTERIDQAKSVNVDGIFYTASLNSISEDMLTPELRNKINARSIALEDAPVTMAAPIAAPVAAIPSIDTSKFLTELPSDLVHEEELMMFAKEVVTKINVATTEAQNYADDEYHKLREELRELAGYVRNIPKVYVNTIPGAPKKGDLVVML